MKRSELKNKIKRRLGWPMIKVELCDDQLNDNIDYSRNKFIKWAIGNATDIIYFTVQLVAGQKFYDMPKGVIDILEYDDDIGSGSTGGGINSLFSVENYLYDSGIYDPLKSSMGFLDYHLVLNFMEMRDRYIPDKYSWRYHSKSNQLEIIPTPEYGDNMSVRRVDPDTNTVKDYILDSPGYVLLKANVIEGTNIPYTIREWDKVLKEIIPMAEHRIITEEESNNDYFALLYPVYKSELAIYLNGERYLNWQWTDDTNRIIYWTNKDDIHINDELILKYRRIDIYPSNDENSYLEDFTYTTDTITLTPLNIATKSFMLSEKAISKENIIITANDKEYVYNSGFNVDIDNQTILFGSHSLNTVLTPGLSIKIVFAGEDTNMEEYDESLYDKGWILDYSTALSKVQLGMIRRKFSSFNSIGNTGISLDGSELVSEGKEEMNELETSLKDEETYEGSYITIG
jgi:hypothetical protein